jgi:hypothetical protein
MGVSRPPPYHPSRPNPEEPKQMRIYAVLIMGGTHHNIVLSIGDGWQAVIHEWKMSEIKLERSKKMVTLHYTQYSVSLYVAGRRRLLSAMR